MISKKGTRKHRAAQGNWLSKETRNRNSSPATSIVSCLIDDVVHTTISQLQSNYLYTGNVPPHAAERPLAVHENFNWPETSNLFLMISRSRPSVSGIKRKRAKHHGDDPLTADMHNIDEVLRNLSACYSCYNVTRPGLYTYFSRFRALHLGLTETFGTVSISNDAIERIYFASALKFQFYS